MAKPKSTSFVRCVSYRVNFTFPGHNIKNTLPSHLSCETPHSYIASYMDFMYINCLPSLTKKKKRKYCLALPGEIKS